MLDKRLMAEARPYLRQWGKIAGLQAIACICTLLFAWYLAKAIHGVVFLHKEFMEVVPFLTVLLFAVCCRALVRWRAELAAYRVAAAVQAQFRRMLLEAFCFRLGPVGLSSEKAGALTIYLNDGIAAFEDYFTKFLPLCLTAALIPLIILFAVIPEDFFSGLVFLLTAPLLPVFMFLIGRQAERANRRQWRLLAKLGAYFLDLLEGLMLLTAFNQVERQRARVAEMSEAFRQGTMKVLRVAFLSAFVLELTATLSIALIAVSVGLRLLEGRFSFAQALFLLLLAPEFYQPLRQLGSAFHQAVTAHTAAVRLYGLLDMPVVLAAGGGEILPEGPPCVEFQNVVYTYQTERDNAADDLTFTAAAGSYTAIVGASGSGKSTIFQLLLGFMSPQSGRILLEGRPLSRLSLPELRQRIAYLQQDPHLFAASAADNIALAKPRASREEIIAAAKKAGIHDFIAALPEGYETMLGSGGKALSGGQKQRIAIARAFLQDAALLLLDEIFTGLDAKSGESVAGALRILAKGKTVIAVTHQPAMAAQADQILVIANGEAVEKGTHGELLRKKGLYAALWQPGGNES